VRASSFSNIAMIGVRHLAQKIPDGIALTKAIRCEIAPQSLPVAREPCATGYRASIGRAVRGDKDGRIRSL
jgi:hypothetical protein